MPKYNWSINDILWEEDAKKVFEKCRSPHERAFIAFTWISGARPAELCKRIVKEDFSIDEKQISVRVHTLKLGRTKSFTVEDRILTFTRPPGLSANIWIETVVAYVQGLPAGAQLFPYTTRWSEKFIPARGMEAIGKPIAPYHLRHSCFTHGARNGWTAPTLMHFKGAKSLKSVEPYIHAVPFVVQMENMRKSKTTVAPSGLNTISEVMKGDISETNNRPAEVVEPILPAVPVQATQAQATGNPNPIQPANPGSWNQPTTNPSTSAPPTTSGPNKPKP